MRILLFTLITLLYGASVIGQGSPDLGVQGHSWDVYLRPGPAGNGETEVVFVDLLTGQSTAVGTSGERHTLFNNAVLFFDREDERVKLLEPDGAIREHPFITLSSADYRIDWTVSADRQLIAWALSRRTEDGQLTTSIMLADGDGGQIRELFNYGPREGIRLLPVAFGAQGSTLYIAVHADGTEQATPYPRSSSIFVLDFGGQSVSTRLLPGESPCFCAIGFGKGVMLRLAPSGALDGTQVEIYDLATGAVRVSDPVSRADYADYNEAGNVLVSPDDSLAIYALTQAGGTGAAERERRTVLVLVDIVNARQRVLDGAWDDLVRPIMWSEDNSAVLFSLEGRAGAWKMRLDEGKAIKVADASYLGMLSARAAA